MKERIEAIAKQELLVWARESYGLNIEDAAKKIGVNIERLQGWESGGFKPTINQLRKMARVYKRPLAVFFLHEVPKTFDAMRDFRKISDISDYYYSPNLNLEIRRTQYKRDIALELFEELEEKVPEFTEKASLKENPELLSNRIRSLLNISIEKQYKWKDSYQSFNAWKESIENLGILVFQTTHTSRIDLSVMRGFSISDKLLPVIVVNSKDSTNGKTFTLLHEFTHLLLHNAGICNLEHYDNPKDEKQQTEVFSNYVSGAVLVPKDILLKNQLIQKKGRSKIWDDNEISELAALFSVSREVILRRLLIFEKTTESFYKGKREEYLELYSKFERSENRGFPPYYRLVLRNNGTAFSRLILNAYYQNVITSSAVSDFLGTKLKHLPSIERAIS